MPPIAMCASASLEHDAWRAADGTEPSAQWYTNTEVPTSGFLGAYVLGAQYK